MARLSNRVRGGDGIQQDTSWMVLTPLEGTELKSLYPQ
jgi:hypothetical protein